MFVITSHQAYQHNIQKTRKRFPATLEAIKKYGNCKRDKLRRRNHENIKMLRRTIYNTIRLQSDRIAKNVNLNKKTFSIDTFQFLNEDLNIVPTPKICNKYRLNEEIQTFSKKMKLKRIL